MIRPGKPARQSGRARIDIDIHRPDASLTAEYIGDKMLPKLFRAVTSAIVALAMLKTRLLVIAKPFPQWAGNPETEIPCRPR
jgi:hypothetical protein